MTRRVFQLYQRHRIINVNLNALGAGLLAILISKVPVLWAAQWIGPEHKLTIAIAAAIIDAIADVLIYFLLHWLANHWRPIKPRHTLDQPDTRFWKNATLVQFERIMFTPAFYIIAVGGMWALQHAGMSASWAFVVAFTAGILTTRAIHTAWCLRTGRFKPVPLSDLDPRIPWPCDLPHPADTEPQRPELADKPESPDRKRTAGGPMIEAFENREHL